MTWRVLKKGGAPKKRIMILVYIALNTMVAPELPLTPPRPDAMLGAADLLRVDVALDAKTETMAS